MNAEPKKTERLSFRESLKKAPKRILRSCAHNWGWKLLSLALAVCLWAFLITQDPTLTRERTFNDVPVTVVGTETLISNGMVVLSGLEDEALLVRLRADVPQRAYSAAAAGNYSPRVDLSRVTDVGEQTLRIQTTSTTTYGTVDSVTPDSVTVVVDEYVTNYRVPVSLNIIGSYPAGYYGTAPVVDPSMVAVSGPKSIVDKITNLYVDYDVSRLAAKEGQIRSALPIRFTDANGKAIASDLLQVISASVVLRTVSVEQRLYPTKTMTVSSAIDLMGEPAEGYEVKSVSASPSTVLAAGDAAALETMDTLFTDSPVDVSGLSEPLTAEIVLRKPGSLIYLSSDNVTVMVDIGPVLTTRVFDGVPLEVRGAAEGLKVTPASNVVSVMVTGPVRLLNQLSASALNAYIDLSGLSAGKRVLPVQVEIADQSELSCAVSPANLSVDIAAE